LIRQAWPNIKRILGYTRKYLGRLVIAGVASLCIAAIDVLTAKLVQPLVDNLMVEPQETLINLVPLVVVSIALFKGAARYTQGYFIKTAGQLVVQDLRNEMFDRSMGLSMRYYANHQSSVITSRVLNNAGVLQRSATEDIVDLVRESASLIGLTGLVFYTDLKLAALAFIILPLSLVPATLVGRKIKHYTRRGLKSIARVTGVLSDTLSGIKVIKAFGTEQRECDRFRDENLNYYKNFVKVLKYDAASKPIIELLASLGIAGVLWFGIARVVGGELTQGQFSSFLAAVMMMYSPVNRLAKINNNLQRTLSAAEQIFELIDEPRDIVDAEDAIELGTVRGEIRFDRVDFAYDDKPVLSGVNIEAAPGEVVALVGPSGAGKSTIVGLLARFYDPQGGSISIDGHDLRQVTLDSLRRNLAYVDQETVLFNATVRHNIAYGRLEATDEEVREAARLAFADEFIMAEEGGYDAIIGDRGMRLSGGQRQRLCIARAILRDAPVLILDEATSALDSESEIVVQQALGNLMQNRTTFVIAHRLSTVMDADKIVVLEGGRVIETGRHHELLERGGMYKKLYEMQFREE
jgi:subfamily B ATP-binding cassette protein MsbA